MILIEKRPIISSSSLQKSIRCSHLEVLGAPPPHHHRPCPAPHPPHQHHLQRAPPPPPHHHVVGEAAAGSGCSSAGKTSSSGGILVRNKRENDKIETKPDQIKKKGETWKSPEVSKTNYSQDNRKKKKIQSPGTKSDQP
nr:hypothetical protein [Tanacetum cinerariifolium]